ncbi:MAG: hypothetical protein ABIR56_17705 [Polaromonas sp.]
MSNPLCVAANMPVHQRQELAISSLANGLAVTHLATQQGVSRQFVYQQKHKAEQAIDQAFAAKDTDVLFHLPVTPAWLDQLVLSLTLTCKSSCRGVKEFMRDMLDVSVSAATVVNRFQDAAAAASTINRAQDLSAIEVGLHDEIFQGAMPVLAGVDAASTYCCLLEAAQQRDADTWAIHLFDARKQGFHPQHTIADAGQGLRAGQKAALPGTPCHGDVFHIQKQCESLANALARLAKGAIARCKVLEQEMVDAKEIGCGNTLSRELALAHQAEQQASRLAKDVRTLVAWLSHDILALAGPDLAGRRVLFDFIVAELSQREHLDSARIRPVRRALENQRDDLLAFDGVLDAKLGTIAQGSKDSIDLVRGACLLQRKSSLSTSYWQRWNQLREKLADKFHGVVAAVVEAMKHIPRASSMVENLNSWLRTYFTLRRQLGTPYLGLLQFFLNHRTFARSRCPERVGKSPAQLLTGNTHPHWLELLGFTRFQRT